MTTMRKSIRSGTSHYPPELVFWPKWEVHLSTGEIIPEQRVAPSWQIPLEQNDFEMSDSLLSSSICKPWSTRHFISNYDLMFIHNYVFEHCENPDATIYYIHEDYLPSTINLVEHVAIHASALSIKKDDLDWVWGTQLRFILRNFPNVRSITLVATTVLNTARPPTCPLPYETIDIEAIDVSDRRRLGLDEGPGAVKLCPETQQPGNFVIQTWEDLSRRWPSWSNRKQANTRSPVLTVMGMMCFAEDWHNLDLQGEHGMSCKVVVERLPAALRTVAKQPISGHRVDKKPSVPRIPSIYALQTHDATELGMKGKTALKRAVSSHTRKPKGSTRDKIRETLPLERTVSMQSFRPTSPPKMSLDETNLVDQMPPRSPTLREDEAELMLRRTRSTCSTKIKRSFASLKGFRTQSNLTRRESGT